MSSTKKIIQYIGIGCIVLVAFGATMIVARKIYTDVWVNLTALFCCPFMASALVNERPSSDKSIAKAILFSVLLLSGWCGFSIMDSHGKAKVKLQSTFLKGEKKHHEVWVDGEERDNGPDVPPHYETQYYFEVAANQPQIVSDIIDWGLFIIVFGIPILTLFIIKKDLS
jgi:hypothetical protein